MAKRVIESIINNTCLPWSLKYSAMVVARYAPLILTRGEESEVAATTTALLRPSSPRVLLIKSFTSLPLSPISPMTTTSALVCLVIMPIKILLPTPDPAIIAIRWPLPRVIMLLIAATPTSRGSLIGALSMGPMGLPYKLYF